jgi:hypothetical protein
VSGVGSGDLRADPGFTIRGRFRGREVDVRWENGHLPQDLRDEVAGDRDTPLGGARGSSSLA